MLVGEVGHETLLHSMRMWHIRAAMRGASRRDRTSWEVGRMNIFSIAKMFGNKEIESFQDVIKFPWDGKRNAPKSISDEDREYLENLIREANANIEANTACL